jgi:hypothetical protein
MPTQILNRTKKVPVNYLRHCSLMQLVRELESGKMDKFEIYRTKGKGKEGVIVSKATYDSLVFNASGPVPAFTLIVETDDYIRINAIKILQILESNSLNFYGYMAWGIRTTANVGRVQTYILDKEYYLALLALQP